MIKMITACVLALAATLAHAEQLVKGQTLTVSGANGSSQFHSVLVPTGASNLRIEISGGSGDADLYTRRGSQPTFSAYDCRPYYSGNNESCHYASPTAGTYHILLHAYSAFANVQLSVSYSGGAVPTPTPTPPPGGSTTLDIVTYNIEWLGDPATAGYNGTRTQQMNAAANDIINGGGEIYALQEIGGSSALNDLLTALNTFDAINDWSGAISQPGATQSLAFVYKTNVVSGVSFQTILTGASSTDFAGRYPYLMTASVSVGGYTESLRLVNLHLKCCTGGSNATRRANAMAVLVTELHHYYRTDNVVVLGDLNVAEQGGAFGEISAWGFYGDRDSNGIPDYSHAAGSLTDEPYLAGNPNSDIDHILIADELKAAWDAVAPATRNQYLSTSVSDHSPVKTTLDLRYFGGAAPQPSPSPSPTPSPSGMSVSQALNQSVGTTLTAIGVIVEAYNGVYALRMRDQLDSSKTIVVKLESSQRAVWSPAQNPSVVGSIIRVSGRRDTYSGLPSIEYVTAIEAL